MKFSYTLIKNLVPELGNQSELAEAFNMHAFEVEGVSGDVIDINVQPNRYSDAASHFGVAREAAAILKLKLKFPKVSSQIEISDKPENFSVRVEDKDLCPRYTAQYFENVKVKSSPAWMQKVLVDCGLRPINNVVDIMNYVMLETGQPLHAFDADKLRGSKLVIRRAKRGESIVSIDGVHYKLEPGMLVIADANPPAGGPQAIAGIKGGKGAEVSSKTKRIIVESANFEPVSIYRTSHKLNLVTDASVRFSHGLSPELAIYGLNRAADLLRAVVGAEAREIFDSLEKPWPRRVLKFDVGKFNDFIGGDLSQKQSSEILIRLGFKPASRGLWEIPDFRTDIETHEDLAEEIIRLSGYNVLESKPPQVALKPSASDDLILFKDKIRKILVNLGLSEIYSHSFISDKEVKEFGFESLAPELQNPVSSEFSFLRPSLLPALIRAVMDNSKHFDDVRIFEIGKAFRRGGKGIDERTSLGIVLASKKGETVFELKGVAAELLEGAGIVDFSLQPSEVEKNSWIHEFVKKNIAPATFLGVTSDNETIGWLGKTQEMIKQWNVAAFEINVERLLGLAEGEEEYEPMPRYPAVMRDVSFLVDSSQRVGEIIQAVQLVNPALIYDVDLIDEYVDEKWKNLESVTFRIIFQAPDRTLKSQEVDKEMEKIISLLQRRFRAKVR